MPDRNPLDDITDPVQRAAAKASVTDDKAREIIVEFLRAWEPQQELVMVPTGERIWALDLRAQKAARAEADRLGDSGD